MELRPYGEDTIVLACTVAWREAAPVDAGMSRLRSGAAVFRDGVAAATPGGSVAPVPLRR